MDKEKKKDNGWYGLDLLEKLRMKYEILLKVDDILYCGQDGEVYYTLAKDEYFTYHNFKLILK